MGECCGYIIPKGEKGGPGEKGQDGKDGADTQQPTNSQSSQPDIAPSDSTDIAPGDPRSYNVPGASFNYYGPEFDFTNKNYVIKAGDLAKDGDLLLIDLLFLKDDNTGGWHPIVFFENTAVSFDFVKNSTNTGNTLTDYYLGTRFMYEVKLMVSRVNNTQIVVSTVSKNMLQTPYGSIKSGDDIQNGQLDDGTAVSLIPFKNPTTNTPYWLFNLTLWNRVQIGGLNLSNQDYTIQYKVVANETGGTGTRPLKLEYITARKIKSAI